MAAAASLKSPPRCGGDLGKVGRLQEAQQAYSMSESLPFSAALPVSQACEGMGVVHLIHMGGFGRLRGLFLSFHGHSPRSVFMQRVQLHTRHNG